MNTSTSTCRLVTGGAGFIGSCYVLRTRAHGMRVVNLDKLTYSGNPENLESLAEDPGYVFVRGDIADTALVERLLQEHQPDAVLNFAAESHVDRSIVDPDAFVRTNVLGACALLRACLGYWEALPPQRKEAFRFLHVSTDEVFGSLAPTDPPFTETTPYAPNSPYAASKAGADHVVRAFCHTYGLPTLITNCSNNYGPRQFPEKLIPLMLCQALERRPLPVYGNGSNIRDWLHVEDHCAALDTVLEKGAPGQNYAVGGRAEHNNLEVVRALCGILDRLRPHAAGPYADLITFVTDRPGHDVRYAIDCSRLEGELGWKPRRNFMEGLENTLRWYLEHPQWLEHVRNGAYRQWMEQHYGRQA